MRSENVGEANGVAISPLFGPMEGMVKKGVGIHSSAGLFSCSPLLDRSGFVGTDEPVEYIVYAAKVELLGCDGVSRLYTVCTGVPWLCG